MTRKAMIVLFIALFASALPAFAASSDILRLFHKQGMSRCDNLVLKHASFSATDEKRMDWSYMQTWEAEPKETVKQMILTLVNYEGNEIIKKVLTYTQTSN